VVETIERRDLDASQVNGNDDSDDKHDSVLVVIDNSATPTT